MSPVESQVPDPNSLLEEKLNSLVELVDEGYGRVLVEQLVQRLEITAHEFQYEVEALVEQLRQNAVAQEELLGKIKEQERLEGQAQSAPERSLIEEIPEWEKKLTELEKSSKQS